MTVDNDRSLNTGISINKRNKLFITEFVFILMKNKLYLILTQTDFPNC